MALIPVNIVWEGLFKDASSCAAAQSGTILTDPNLGYKTFLCSNQLTEHEFILLINVKMPIIVGILTFISRINTPSFRWCIYPAYKFKKEGQRNIRFSHFSLNEQLKFHAVELIMINVGVLISVQLLLVHLQLHIFNT